LEGTERPTALPSGFWLEAAYRKRTRQTPEHFYDRILGRFPGDDAPRWRDSHASDPLSDIMEARRLLLETDRFQGDSPQVRHSDPLTSAAYWREFFASVPGARHDIGSSTACFECGATVKTEHIWLKKNDPNIAMCEGCFRTAEAAGRAKDAG
jgi:hypothetical protein